MKTFAKVLVKRLPQIHKREQDLEDATLDAMALAFQVMPEAYARHFGLTKHSGKVRFSCYHITSIRVNHPVSGEECDAVGAAMGPKGLKPAATLIVFVDRPEVIICESATQWLEAIGEETWPTNDQEVDLDEL